MSILKYKDPQTGEFKRINPYKADFSFVGKDGIVVNKASNSEMVEISGKGCVQKSITAFGIVYGKDYAGNETTIAYSDNESNSTIAKRQSNGELLAIVSDTPTDNTLTNKKYVADNYVEKVKFTNLEQALNGYILDTTKEAYADLDSAVLKNSVAVGDNVYPIADKTRALVTRIEGNTTKMVQLLDKNNFPATKAPSAGVTVTKTDDGGLHVFGTSSSSGGRTSWGITVKIEKGHKYLNSLKGNKKLTAPFITLKTDSTQYFTIADIATSTIEGECLWGFNVTEGDYDETIYPNLFDLTAMNREDITTVEQFKAEFPDLYPYGNGNIYPAKISGVKFTGKNLLKLKLSSTNNCTANIEDDVLKITPTTSNAEDIVFAEVKTHLKAGEYVLSSISENQNTTPTQFIVSKGQYGENNITTISPKGTKFTLDSETDIYILIYPCLHAELPLKAMSVQIQIQAGSQATAYEPYIEPVSVTLPETYDLHGIGDYKDYLEITKNENNELYTLKKVQNVGVHEYTGNEAWTVGSDNMTSVFRYYCTDIEIPKSLGDKGICNKYATLTGVEDKEGVLFGSSNAYIYLFLNKTNFPDINSVKSYLSAQYAGNNPVVIYYRLSSPVETVIAKNLTYEQVTAIRHNGGLIEVEGNTNNGYARPTVTNTIVYRLTATNTAEA